MESGLNEGHQDVYTDEHFYFYATLYFTIPTFQCIQKHSFPPSYLVYAVRSAQTLLQEQEFDKHRVLCFTACHVFLIEKVFCLFGHNMRYSLH